VRWMTPHKRRSAVSTTLRPVPAPSGSPPADQTVRERRVVLQIIQPGLAGLMDGSVSTLAPIFATAFATHLSHTVFLVGLAAALGAGISMAFSEALSDDGSLTGRGNPLVRGAVTGLNFFLSCLQVIVGGGLV